MYHTLDEWIDIERHRTLGPNEVVQLIKDWEEDRAIRNEPKLGHVRIAKWRGVIENLAREHDGGTLGYTPVTAEMAMVILDDWEENHYIEIAPPPHSRGRIAEWRERIQSFEVPTDGKKMYDMVPWEEASKILDDWEADKIYLLAVIRDVSQKLATAAARYEELLF